MTAVAVTAIAGTALLTSLSTAVYSSTQGAHRAVARGMADQLMDEISSVRFPAADDSRPQGTTRQGFDDIDDFAGWSSRPPRSRDGQVLGADGGLSDDGSAGRPAALQADGEFVGRFTREVTVERVTPTGNGNWQVVSQHTDYRRVTVRVSYTDGNGNTSPIAETTRIHSHVSTAP